MATFKFCTPCMQCYIIQNEEKKIPGREIKTENNQLIIKSHIENK